jgi:hypothetical protein
VAAPALALGHPGAVPVGQRAPGWMGAIRVTFIDAAFARRCPSVKRRPAPPPFSIDLTAKGRV